MRPGKERQGETVALIIDEAQIEKEALEEFAFCEPKSENPQSSSRNFRGRSAI
jgi:hypothetical protein